MPSIIHKGGTALKPGNAAAPTTHSAPAAAVAKPGLSFIKRGAQAAVAMQQEEKKIEMMRKDKIFRFWLADGAKGDFTFLDGNLKDGTLDIPYYHEHNTNIGGKWNNFFICTQDEEPCPICEGGDGASFVGAFTVIDHAEYVSKKDNLKHKDTVKLLVAKRDSIKLFQDMAVKRGGLRGCRFEVKRIGDKAPNIGNHFDFTQKYTEAELKQLWGAIKVGKEIIDKTKPVNYEAYLAEQYVPADELRKLGFGTIGSPVGSESADEGKYQL